MRVHTENFFESVKETIGKKENRKIAIPYFSKIAIVKSENSSRQIWHRSRFNALPRSSPQSAARLQARLLMRSHTNAPGPAPSQQCPQ
jgi:hypothetical protein